jgi:hypothetical protein
MGLELICGGDRAPPKDTSLNAQPRYGGIEVAPRQLTMFSAAATSRGLSVQKPDDSWEGECARHPVMLGDVESANYTEHPWMVRT